ncbi:MULTISPECIES: hypothetical protein [unclassified Variovorax]|uniref:hypothetical protein n=1 Tax=unclassified Variovorax TaxID=663243 RepID=UPI00083950F6|nr:MULTISPECIES: hypothetical protein [unclassified Variovorax]PNG53160.1 hypothetical protein CHC06_04505 [Variovorax sp. B2]PNG53732.1 hypothetical protein CHC07_03552 [Variovorax sp. B4]VTV11183.1 hypothetical protein WDL1CHR_02066 [Variovorax sp. WDL1]
MPATPEEFERLIDAFDNAHAPVARAMADLLLRGNVILEEHQMLEGPIGDAFEAFVFNMLAEQGISKEAFAETLRALVRLRDTIDHLDQLPP